MLYFKLVRFSGVSNLTLYSDITRSKTIDLGNEQASSNNFVLTASERSSHHLSDKFVVGVSSSSVATFKLMVELDNKKYSEIWNNEPEFGILDAGEVDNLIYRTSKVSSDNNTIFISLRIKMLQGQLVFGVRRCKSLETQNSTSCIYNTMAEVQDNPEDLSEITGTLHNYPNSNLTEFTFAYDTKRCPPKTKAFITTY